MTSESTTRRRGWPWPEPELLLTVGLCLFALWPLATVGGLAEGHDTLLHLYRVAEMDRAWSHGVLMPRWAESFYFGYGSPVFHYYASLVYYIACLLARGLALDVFAALRVVVLLALPLAGAGMYLFVRARGGRLAGVIAGLCYVYSPYLLHREPHVRGDYPELLAFALFPFIMWRYERLALSGRARDLAPAALLTGALILSHNLMALTLFALLAGWIVWGRMVGALDWQRWVLATAAAGLGLGLAAYFWIPVLVDRDAVHLDNLTGIPSLDYRNSFLYPDELLAFAPRADAGAINGLAPTNSLGVGPWLLALIALAGVVIGLARTWGRSGRLRLPVDLRARLYFVLAAGVMIGLTLPLAEPVWDAVGVIAYLQFPWRLLGPVAFCLSVIASQNAEWIVRLPGRWGGAVVAGVVLVVPALTMPLWYIDSDWRLFARDLDFSVARYHELEQSSVMPLGTTVTNEFLPAAVHVIPGPTEGLLADYADGYPVEKLPGLPPGVNATRLEHGPQSDVWRVVAEQPARLEVLTFDFIGWRAFVDGREVPITPSEPHGLITFEVPAGEHTVRLEMGPTPLWRLAEGISWASVVALVLLTGVLAYRRRGKTPLSDVEAAPDPGPEPARAVWRRGIVVGGLLLIGMAAVFMREGRAWVNSPPGEVVLADHTTSYFLDGTIELLGYDLSTTHPKPGGRLTVTLYWYAHQPVDVNYNTFMHFSTGGPPLAQQDKVQGDILTRGWTPDGYIRDEYVLRLPEGLPPGAYQLLAGMWICTDPSGQCPDGGRLPVTDANGQPLGDQIFLQAVTVD